MTAAGCAGATPASARSCSAGLRRAATTAAACSSTCAIAAASPRWCSNRGPTPRRTGWPASCAANSASASRASSSSAAATRTRTSRPARSKLKADALTIFSRAETPPFEIVDDTAAGETVRLKHRYLDLRRPALQRNFLVRSKIYQTTRQTLAENGFAEIETPFMVKYTPGGARNFLVPSRLNPGQFYALAESPQIFKQLFMVAGIDRYFQIVRCFRDEDLRLDRQPEFTQIDLEMSFVVEEDVQNIVEKLMAALWKDVLGIELARPFLRLSYARRDGQVRLGQARPPLRAAARRPDRGGHPPRRRRRRPAAVRGQDARAASSRDGGCRPRTPRRCRAPTSTSSRSSPRASGRAAWRAPASAKGARGRRAR